MKLFGRNKTAPAPTPRPVVVADGSGELGIEGNAVYSLDLREPYPIVRRMSNDALAALLASETEN